MKKRLTPRFWAALAGLGCLLLILVAGLCGTQDAQESAGKKVEISQDSGFYAEDIEIKVTYPAGVKVYYTDTCAEPSAETGTLYNAPIRLVAEEEEQVYVYRFLAVYEDGRESEEWVRTYFVGKHIQERYNMMVLNVTGDPDGLFSYENGIFVPGQKWDEFWEANPDAHVGGDVEANFTMRGMEWERPVYAQFFTSDGEEFLSQNCGVRIHGDQTRIKNQKTFRLFARKEYDVENEFDFAFFGDLQSDVDGVLGAEYKRLVVRSSGNDNGYGYIRTELVGKLAADAGFPDTISAVPICVYINGIYQGVYWLENYYDSKYFENRYGAYTGEFVILEGGDLTKADSDDAFTQEYVEDYNSAYARFAAMDMTDDANFQELCEFMDVENYLKYFAIEHYVGNDDWPDYNLKVYRYVAEDGNYTPDSVFDGRYRFLLFDTDYGFGLLTFNETYGIYAQKATLNRILSEETPLFVQLMQRQDCLEYFVNYTCDLFNGAMTEAKVTALVDEMHASRYAELYHMLEETDIMKGSLWEAEEDLHIDTADKNIQIIKDFARIRPETVIRDLQETLGCGDIYTLQIDKGDSFSSVKVNSFYVTDSTFEGTYFADYTVELQAVVAENENFVAWEVNGERREGETLVLTAEDVVRKQTTSDSGADESLDGIYETDGQISVRLITEDKEDAVLQIAAVKAKGQNDYVEVVNRSRQVVSTRGYFLTDDSTDLTKYAFPAMSLQPGETLRLYGKDVNDTEALGQLGMNFNLKAGETVSLTYMEEVVDSVTLPELSAENGVYTKVFKTGKYVEEF